MSEDDVHLVSNNNPTTQRAARTATLAAYLLLAIATIAQIGVSVAQQGVGTLVYAFLRHYHLSLAEAGTLVTVSSTGVMLAMIFGGRIVDQRGPRPVLFAAAVLAALATLLIGTVHGLAELYPALFLLGFALGAAPIAGARAIFVRFQGSLRGTAMGIRQTGVPLGGAIAAAVLPQLASRVGPTATFPLLAPELLLTGVVFALLVRQMRQTAQQAAAAARDSLRPLILPGLVGFMLVAGQYDLLAFTIDHLTVSGFPLWAAALGLTAAQLGGSVGRVGFGFISDRIHSRPIAIAMSAVIGAVGVAVTALLPASTPLVLVIALFFLTGAGAIGWNALVLTWGAERVVPERAGTALGLIGASTFLGSATFPPIFGLIAIWLHSYSGAYMVLSIQLLLAAAIAFTLGRRPVARAA